ncbi:biotin-dependent carboxyltransferase family protein [Alteromonas facilis]|uniref:5-oxoprolinase subunit C family protein n=1 Tax=Alteromonas facilis TaxID=2048004 RepID=UPI0013DAFA6D|nr:biotin-dependent carboxyltransferase family protein [Alteromonas facilis]
MTILVKNVPLQALIVDRGRLRQQYLGATPCGPLDHFAYAVNGWLMQGGNSNAQIEIIHGSFSFSVSKAMQCSVAGPDVHIQINGIDTPAWQVLQLHAGDEVSICTGKAGNVAYVSFSHQLVSEVAFGSVCTVVREQVGGLDGKGSVLKRGDEIRTFQSAKSQAVQLSAHNQHKLSELVNRMYRPRALGVLPGNQIDEFGKLGWLKLLTEEFQLTDKRSRMGYRLSGSPIRAQKQSMPSEPLTVGTIQIPADGQPIVMMADHQTMGGYPKIANIQLCDIPYFAQRGTGDTLTFTESEAAVAAFEITRIHQRFHDIFN